jgi:hypothetical protein
MRKLGYRERGSELIGRLNLLNKNEIINAVACLIVQAFIVGVYNIKFLQGISALYRANIHNIPFILAFFESLLVNIVAFFLLLLIIRFFSKPILSRFPQTESLRNDGLLRIIKKYGIINITLYNIFQAFMIGSIVAVEIFTDDAVDPYGMSPVFHYFIAPTGAGSTYFTISIVLSSFLLLCVLAVRIFLKKIASLLLRIIVRKAK